mmetsp:Transcript_41120/g.66128  ORF Transcript_41120/g.66128 Transcript_41120/m.66128 type:complete len:107 (+) Transcript_41120:631-951(+)
MGIQVVYTSSPSHIKSRGQKQWKQYHHMHYYCMDDNHDNIIIIIIIIVHHHKFIIIIQLVLVGRWGEGGIGYTHICRYLEVNGTKQSIDILCVWMCVCLESTYPSA